MEKLKDVGRSIGRTASYKKAIVKLTLTAKKLNSSKECNTFNVT